MASKAYTVLSALFVVCLVWCGQVSAAYYSTTFIYPTDCGKTKTLSSKDYGVLKLSSRFSTYTYSNSYPCEITYQCSSSFTSDCRLFFRAEENWLCTSADTDVSVYDGTSSALGNILFFFTPTSSVTSSYRKTSGRSMTIEIVKGRVSSSCVDRLNLRYNSFTVLDYCPSYDHECSNGWCIDSNLKCDNYQNCADNSDEYNCHSYTTYTSYSSNAGAIAGGVIGVVVFFAIIGIIAGVVRRRRTVVTHSTVSAAPALSSNVVVAGATTGYSMGPPPPAGYSYPAGPPPGYVNPPPPYPGVHQQKY